MKIHGKLIKMLKKKTSNKKREREKTSDNTQIKVI